MNSELGPPGVFPFGAPIRDCGTAIPTKHSPTVIIGAYPSALHVTWIPPKESGLRPIAALAVDNEPTPFWDGTEGPDWPSAELLTQAWTERYFDLSYGTVKTSHLNGPSGAWVRRMITEPLALEESSLITDCLPTYRASTRQTTRILDTYRPFARARQLPQAELAGHPSENDIVRETVAHHTDRIVPQLKAASPDLLVTLGAAAARVVGHLTTRTLNRPALSLATYGQRQSVTISELETTWLALAHPAAPRRWQEAHQAWLGSLKSQ